MGDDVDRRDAVVGSDLEEILGARSRVAVLRALSKARFQTWPAAIVRRTGLPKSTVWTALDRLHRAGIAFPVAIEFHRQVPWRIRHDHLLKAPLAALFKAEEETWLPEEKLRELREHEAVMERVKADLRSKGFEIDEEQWSL